MATEWKKVKISSVCEGIYDGPHATPPISDTGFIFLGISNITEDGHLDLSSPKYINERDFPRWTKRVTPYHGDIVFSYEATLNLYAIIPENFKGCLGRRMALIRPNLKKIDRKFLFYYFFSPEWRNLIFTNTITGATVDRISLINFPNFEISLPPLETQQKIAGTLSAYDDLIENNRKQIKLLEEVAQKLYKEWFVKLNFPGHENVKIIDGVPEGWKNGIISELGEFKRGKTITKDQTIPGNVPVVAGGLEPAYYHNESNTETPVITVSGSGANAGFTRLYYEKVWASDCSYLDISKCKNLLFVYCVLKNSKTEIDNLQKGAAQPHVYAKDLNAITTVIPSQIYLEKFSAIVKPYFEKIKTVQNQIEELQSARDKLLPKLMNGVFYV